MLGPLDEPLHIPKLDLALWVFLVAACGGAVYGSLEASKGLAKSYTGNRKQIEAAEKSLQKAAKPAKGGARPNAAAKKKVDSQNSALKKQLNELWQELHERQAKFTVWPKIADLASDANELKADAALPAPFCKAYNETVMRSEFERLFNKLDIRRPKPASKNPRAENLPFTDHPPDFDGLVAWSPELRAALLARYHVEKGTPSSQRVRIWQEDLWLFESLVNAVGSLNENATDPLSAPLKQIDVLDVAQWAVAAAGHNAPTIWLPDEKEAAHPEAPAVPTAESSDEALLNGRYLDENGRPLGAGKKPPFAEFRQVFVYVKLVVDQRHLDALMAALANAALPVEARHLVVHVPTDTTVRPASNEGEAPAAAPAAEAKRTDTDTPQTSGSAPLATAETTPWDVVVEIGGTVYLYNPPQVKKLGTGAAGKPGQRSFRTPVAASVP